MQWISGMELQGVAVRRAPGLPVLTGLAASVLCSTQARIAIVQHACSGAMHERSQLLGHDALFCAAVCTIYLPVQCDTFVQL